MNLESFFRTPSLCSAFAFICCSILVAKRGKRWRLNVAVCLLCICLRCPSLEAFTFSLLSRFFNQVLNRCVYSSGCPSLRSMANSVIVTQRHERRVRLTANWLAGLRCQCTYYSWLPSFLPSWPHTSHFFVFEMKAFSIQYVFPLICPVISTAALSIGRQSWRTVLKCVSALSHWESQWFFSGRF